MKYIFLITLIFTQLGCQSFKAGYWYEETKIAARQTYLLVDAKEKNFGFRRVDALRKIFPGLEPFFIANGYPDFIFEYKNRSNNNKIYFYVENDIAYHFAVQGFAGTKISIIETRPLTDKEKQAYEKLKVMNQDLPESQPREIKDEIEI